MKGHKTKRGTTRYDRPWLCHACGLMLDAISDMRGDKQPVPGKNILICIGCGTLSFLTENGVRPLTTAEREALKPAERREIEEHRWALEAVWRSHGPVRDRRGGRA